VLAARHPTSCHGQPHQPVGARSENRTQRPAQRISADQPAARQPSSLTIEQERSIPISTFGAVRAPQMR
jgi:hypothetical protein